MIGWLIALAVIVLLAITPIGVSAMYDANGPLVRLIAGPMKMTVYPSKSNPEGEKAKTTKPSAVSKPTEAKKTSEKNEKTGGGSVADFLPLVKIVLELLDDFRWKLRVSKLYLKVILAGGDPCDLATNYGKAWAAIGNLWPLLERSLVIKKRDVEVACDFVAEQTLVTARLDLTITIGRLIHLCGKHGIRALREYLNIMKSRKGGMTK